MNTLALKPDESSRTAMAAVVAIALHAALLLGIGFEMKLKPPADTAERLDVILVNWKSEEAPEEAEYLAQVNQTGGSDSRDMERPSAPDSSVMPELDPAEESTPPATEAPPPAEPQQAIVDQAQADSSVELQTTEQAEADLPLPTAAELMASSRRMAQLAPEVDTERNPGSRWKRKKFISANTREYEFASYMQAWVAKVERIGKMNFPNQLHERGISGDLVLTVGIQPDGSVETITVQRSSGYPVLDAAARHIVNVAAPYPPLPPEITAQTDLLYITRTWRFTPAGSLSSGRGR